MCVDALTLSKCRCTTRQLPRGSTGPSSQQQYRHMQLLRSFPAVELVSAWGVGCWRLPHHERGPCHQQPAGVPETLMWQGLACGPTWRLYRNLRLVMTAAWGASKRRLHLPLRTPENQPVSQSVSQTHEESRYGAGLKIAIW